MNHPVDVADAALRLAANEIAEANAERDKAIQERDDARTIVAELKARIANGRFMKKPPAALVERVRVTLAAIETASMEDLQHAAEQHASAKIDLGHWVMRTLADTLAARDKGEG